MAPRRSARLARRTCTDRTQRRDGQQALQRVVDSDVEAVAIAAADEVSAYIDPTAMTPDDEGGPCRLVRRSIRGQSASRAKWAYHAARTRVVAGRRQQ